jgi:steroid delta-isomerase
VRPGRRHFAGGGRGRIQQLAAASIFAAGLLLEPPTQSSGAGLIQTAQDEIRSALENWRSAFNERDCRRVCDLFAPDLVANYQGEPERDYASLCQLLQTTLQDSQTVYNYSLKINEILVYGEVAIVRVVWTLEIDKADKPKEILEESAIDMFRHQADGSWKIARYLAYPSSP